MCARACCAVVEKEGRHEIRVRAVDPAGNLDPSPATYSWIVDRAGVYGHPSMATDVVAEGGNKQVRKTDRTVWLACLVFQSGFSVSPERVRNFRLDVASPFSVCMYFV